jgi:integrase
MYHKDSKGHVEPSALSGMLASRKGNLMRRRYQTGQLIDDKDRWCARWREDVLQPDGSVKRIRKWDVIAMKRDCPTRRMAQRILDEKLRLINREDYKPAPAETFAEFADRWMKSVLVHDKPSTQETDRRNIERDLKPVFGRFPMREITAEMIQTWVSGLPHMPKTVTNLKTIFCRMWKTAKTWNYVQHDPFEGLKLPKFKKGNVYQFSAEEMMAIINEAKGWHKLFFRMLGQTGMRPGEAAGLRVQDLDGRVLNVQQSAWKGNIQTPKTEDSVRNFSISEGLAEDLRHHIAESPNAHGLIFVNSHGNPINTSHFVDKTLNPILEKLGIRAKIRALGVRCGNYAFRHGNMTELSRSGVPLRTIQSRVGHAAGSDVTMTHYIHAVSADDLAAADLMDALLSEKKYDEAIQ